MHPGMHVPQLRMRLHAIPIAVAGRMAQITGTRKGAHLCALFWIAYRS
jgi:hypothetical protein